MAEKTDKKKGRVRRALQKCSELPHVKNKEEAYWQGRLVQGGADKKENRLI